MADNELLADYEDEEPEYPTAAGAGATVAAGGDEADKKNYAGIHSSGFRYVHVLFIRQGPTRGLWSFSPRRVVDH